MALVALADPLDRLIVFDRGKSAVFEIAHRAELDEDDAALAGARRAVGR